MSESAEAARRAFHIMTKPIGPVCNLNCKYCFYLDKRALYPGTTKWRMSDEVLESYVRQYIEAQEVPEAAFAWQGGEPTLMGVDFFRRAVELQRKYANGKKITNAMQTNGTLLDEEWCRFLAENKFLVGLSIDGPRDLHDRHRLDRRGRPTFDAVMRGMELMKKHGVDFNALCVVNSLNAKRPRDVYRFLKNNGSGFIQFIPLVERIGTGDGKLAEPPRREAGDGSGRAMVAPWSVGPEAMGDFLCAIFDEWVRRDVGRVFVQIFDVMLGVWMGMPASLCVFGETCGHAMALEHNGDLYACDHYVYERYRLGNIMERSLRELVKSERQRKFGMDKRDALPEYCRKCDVKFACQGECPKHRFLKTPEGEDGLNYLCEGYKKFLAHIDEPMQMMAGLLRQGMAAAGIMHILGGRDRQPQKRRERAGIGRNDPCPCGSGRKFKRCCWDKVRGG